jgi:hypothetical protein
VVEKMISKYCNELSQEDWPDFLFSAAYAYNKSINSVCDLSPDNIMYGKNPFKLVDFAYVSERVVKDEEVNKWIERITKGFEIMRGIIKEIKINNKKKGKESDNKRKIEKGIFVILKRGESVDKSLNKKLTSKNIGPFKVLDINKELNRVTLQITPSKEKEVKLQDVEYYSDEYVREEDRYYNDLKEIIPLKVLKEREYKKEERVVAEKEKKNLTVKELVGRRISIRK